MDKAKRFLPGSSPVTPATPATNFLNYISILKALSLNWPGAFFAFVQVSVQVLLETLNTRSQGPVTSEAAGSSPITPANHVIKNIIFKWIFCA